MLPLDLTAQAWAQPIKDGCAAFAVEPRGEGFQVSASIATARGDTMTTALPVMSRAAAWQLAQRLSLVLLATEEDAPGTAGGRG